MVGLIFGIIFLLAGIGVGVFFLMKTETDYACDTHGYTKRDENGNRIAVTAGPGDCRYASSCIDRFGKRKTGK